MTREPSGSMIFHHPLEVGGDSSRGSALRPAQMLRAFEELGYEVVQVTGESRERAQRCRQVLKDVVDGRIFDFVYGESATTPNALSDAGHLPRHPLLDAQFLRRMRGHGIPVGVFYRDVYWRFDEYKAATTLPIRTLAKAFYRLDLLAYRMSCDVMFLPSLAMADALPRSTRESVRFAPLPPGGDRAEASERCERAVGGPLELLYVGGVTPPLYDIRPLLDAVANEPDVRLTVCCRVEERTSLPSAMDNVTVVHESGPALADLYRAADLATVLFGEHPYRRFAVPVKLFEAVSHGVPILADASTAAGETVRTARLGISVDDPDDLPTLIRQLAADRTRLDHLRTTLRAVQDDHTWLSRARCAAAELADPGPPGS